MALVLESFASLLSLCKDAMASNHINNFIDFSLYTDDLQVKITQLLRSCSYNVIIIS